MGFNVSRFRLAVVASWSVGAAVGCIEFAVINLNLAGRYFPKGTTIYGFSPPVVLVTILFIGLMLTGWVIVKQLAKWVGNTYG